MYNTIQALGEMPSESEEEAPLTPVTPEEETEAQEKERQRREGEEMGGRNNGEEIEVIE